MGFKQRDIDKLLAECHRRCCICYKFCGFKMEVHHIKQKVDKGDDDIKNGIPLCFECHSEVAFYNPQHPKGRKYSESELFEHKKLWLDLCKNNPLVLVSAARNSDIGSLEGMVLELDFNLRVAKLAEGAYPQERIGCSLKVFQHEKSMADGSILLLSDDVREKVNEAYLKIGRANNFISTLVNVRPIGSEFSTAQDNIFVSLRDSVITIEDAFNSLKEFLSVNQ